MIAQPRVHLGSRDREVECARGRMRIDRKRTPAHRVGAGSQCASETDDHNLLVRRIVDGLARPESQPPWNLTTETAEKAVTTPWV